MFQNDLLKLILFALSKNAKFFLIIKKIKTTKANKLANSKTNVQLHLMK